MARVARRPLPQCTERAVEARRGVPVIAEVLDGGAGPAVALSGRVDSAEVRRRTAAVAARLARGSCIENDLVVEADDPARPLDAAASIAGAPGVWVASPDVAALLAEFELELDLADPPLAAGVAELPDEDEADGVFFPPTDPVVAPDAHGRLQVLGGFSATSMDSLEVEPSASDGRAGDEALADAIRRELREDALTTDLQFTVAVRRGVAYLFGRVPDLDDAEDAEEVAARVPGVREVVERLTVAYA